MKKSILRIAASGMVAVAAFGVAQGQQRYLDEIFTEVNTETGTYGEAVHIFAANVEDIILPTPSPDAPQVATLKMEMYTPEGDTETDRAAVIVLHTGNFLPRYFNGATTGSRQDSSVVTLCKSLAKRGFVAMAISYRLGWNPLSTEAEVRRATLLNAVYRGLHDVKTAVRFLKSSADDGNPHGIDPAKISVFGFGTGGYLASNYGALDRIEELQIEKFVDGEGNLFVNTDLVGNIDGAGGNPAVNILNHEGYCNDVMAVVNAGGALGDSTWIEAGEVPMISFHCPDDPFAPFIHGTVVVPTTNENVVDVSGSRFISGRATALGNNAVFAGPYTDDYSVAAEAAISSDHPALGLDPADYLGLFPFRRPTISPDRRESSPWDFWDPAVVEASIDGINDLLSLSGADPLDAQEILEGSLNNHPDMSPELGKSYLDSIVNFMCPRLVSAMEDAEEPAGCMRVSIDNIEGMAASNTLVYPNPAQDFIMVETSDNVKVNGVEVFNLTGSLVASEYDLNTLSRQISVASLPSGLYLVRVLTDNGFVTRKVFKD